MQIVESELENINDIDKIIYDLKTVKNIINESLDIPLITFIYNYCEKHGIKTENETDVTYEISKDNLTVIINDNGEIQIL